MQRVFKFIFLSILSVIFLCGCEERSEGQLDPAYAEFLEVPGIENWGDEICTLLKDKLKSDGALRAEGFDDEAIADVRDFDIDGFIKELVTVRDLRALGATAEESIAFRRFVDEFYDEDISVYFPEEIAQVAPEKLKEMGFSEEYLQSVEDHFYVRDHVDELSDEELAAYGYTREQAETIRDGGEVVELPK